MRPKGTPNSVEKRLPEKVELTDPFVRGLKKPALIYDRIRPGLSIRVTGTGKKGWKFSYRFNNRPRLFTIGDANRIALKEARMEARKLDSKILQGIDPQTEKKLGRKSGTFRELVENFLVGYPIDSGNPHK